MLAGQYMIALMVFRNCRGAIIGCGNLSLCRSKANKTTIPRSTISGDVDDINVYGIRQYGPLVDLELLEEEQLSVSNLNSKYSSMDNVKKYQSFDFFHGVCDRAVQNHNSSANRTGKENLCYSFRRMRSEKL